MTVLQVADVSFGYGANRLFEGVTFSVQDDERVALVAPNGAGKSTLLRLLTGELAPDGGSVVVRREARVGYYRQSHEHNSEGIVMEAFLSGFRDVLALRHALAEAQHMAATGREEDLERLTRATDAYHLAHGDELERKVESIAGKLGFRPADMTRPVVSLSGGERGRLQLGVVLAQEPDLLLLDEPTNHLDLDTIDWLEQHLRSFRGAVIVVSHDRAFLDAVTGTTMELGRRSFRVYPVRYSEYAVAREADLARERELAERQQAMIEKTEDFIRRNIAGQKTKQAQSRRKMLEKVDRLDRPEDVWAVAEKVRFRFAPAPRTGDIVLEATGLGARRGERKLFGGLDLLVRRGDRIGIVGPNGSGKTTLLRLLANGPDGDSNTPGGDKGEPSEAATTPGDASARDHDAGAAGDHDAGAAGDHDAEGSRGCSPREPEGVARGTRVETAGGSAEDEGAVRRGTNLQQGFFDQHLGTLNPERTAIDEIRSIRGDLSIDATRQYLARFRFYGDDTFRKVASFSGGERSRLSLAKLLLEPRNLLFLDEPTNHLDIPACEILEEALVDFQGTVILVSHDRRFLENVTTRIVSLRGGAYELFPAGFRDYVAAVASGIAGVDADDGKAPRPRGAPARRHESDAAPERVQPIDKAARKAAFEQAKAELRAVERKRKRIAELETQIADAESEVAGLRERLKAAPGDDWEKLAELAGQEQAIARRIESMMAEWSTLSEEAAREEAALQGSHRV